MISCFHWLAALFVLSAGLQAQSATKPNILFIAIDDMNDWTGFLDGHPQSLTPHLDRLAERGMNFTNAHCVSPACSPSRNALLYGVEPFHSGLYPFYNHDEIPAEVLDQYTSLPRFFKQNGYQTFGAGKIHHGSVANPEEWTEYLKNAGRNLKYKPEAGYQIGDSRKMAFCPTTSPLEDHHDYQVASFGVNVLSRNHQQPFFLAVGIVKPHLAFVCPEPYFEPFQTIKAPRIKALDHNDIPWAGRAMSKINDDFRYRTDQAWERVRRAYLACIHWADFNIGRVIEALENSPYANNTIIVAWSDHGYHLGEKRSFRKFSLWEEATRVPFILYDPRQSHRPDQHQCHQAVSLIHVYRTLCDLSGLSVPEYVDGVSLAPQLKDPQTPVSYPAITTWGRGNYSLRTEKHRYIRYFDGSEELYDHSIDPDEWDNLADHSDWKSLKTQLAQQLPADEAPLVREGISLWNVVDADKPNLGKTKSNWKKLQGKISPMLAK